MRRNMSGNFGLYKYLWPGSVYIYTIKTQLKYIYTFICTELIEETGRPPGMIFRLPRASSSLEIFFIHLTIMT